MLFRRNQVRVKVYHVGKDCFSAWATDGDLNVYNCYGSTKEAAKQMAMVRLSKIHEERASKNHPNVISIEAYVLQNSSQL